MTRLCRWLVTGVALAAAPVTLAVGAGVAWADQPVVQAVIYPGSQGGVRTVTVTDGQLNGCSSYDGSAPFLLQPGGSTYQPAATAWSLATVVQCGLRVPRAALTDVTVQSAIHGPETPLTPADVFDPAQYHDPTAPAALPLVSLNGASGAVTYERPWRGGRDANAADQVVNTGGPVTITVYENAAPLQVRIVPTRLSTTSGSQQDRFTTQVLDQAGRPVAAGGLSLAWTFGDGTGASASQPTHRFTAGRWFVGVTVADPGAGTGGTATIVLSVDGGALTGGHDRGGAGRNRKPTSRSGAVHGTGTAPQGTTRPSHHSGASATVTNPAASSSPTASTPSAVTPAPSASNTRPRHPTGVRSARGRHRPGPRRPARHRTRPVSRPSAATRNAMRLISGQLVASLQPVAAASSPLTQAADTAVPVAAVGAATRTSSVVGWVAALVAALLLGLGAAREQSGRRRRGGPPGERAADVPASPP